MIFYPVPLPNPAKKPWYLYLDSFTAALGHLLGRCLRSLCQLCPCLGEEGHVPATRCRWR